MNPFPEWIRSFDEQLGNLRDDDDDDDNNNNVKKQLVL